MGGKCECEDPGCVEHPEKYKCRRAARVLLTFDRSGDEMQLCQGCADDKVETLDEEMTVGPLS